VKVRVRDGCRGGQEQFRWNQVTNQDFKDREQYLGATTKVGMMGKFGRYYLHDWYTKKRDTAESINEELGNVKAYEEELMQEALGLKPKRLLLQKKQMSEEELKVFLAKEKPEGRRGRDQMGPQKKIVANEFGEQVTEEDYVGKAYLDSTIKGVGFASHRSAKLEEYKAQVIGTEAKLEGCKEQGIKVEDWDGTDVVKLGFGHVKSESSSSHVKTEPKAEEDLKREPGDVKDDPTAVADDAKDEGPPGDPANEGFDGAGRAPKRRREGEESDERRLRKAEKKLEKKYKKVKRQQKQAEKKLRKAAKQVKKAEKKAKARKKSSSSTSSSS